MKSPKLISNISENVFSLTLKPCKIVAKKELQDKYSIARSMSSCVRQGKYNFSSLFERDPLSSSGGLFALSPSKRLREIVDYIGGYLPDSYKDILAITRSGRYIVYWSFYNTCLEFTIKTLENKETFLVLTQALSDVAIPVVDYSQVVESTPNNNYYKVIASEWRNNFTDLLMRNHLLDLPPLNPVSWEVDPWEKGEYSEQLPWLRFTFNIPIDRLRQNYFTNCVPEGIEIKEAGFFEGIAGNPSRAYIRISADPERCVILQ